VLLLSCICLSSLLAIDSCSSLLFSSLMFRFSALLFSARLLYYLICLPPPFSSIFLYHSHFSDVISSDLPCSCFAYIMCLILCLLSFILYFDLHFSCIIFSALILCSVMLCDILCRYIIISYLILYSLIFDVIR